MSSLGDVRWRFRTVCPERSPFTLGATQRRQFQYYHSCLSWREVSHNTLNLPHLRTRCTRSSAVTRYQKPLPFCCLVCSFYSKRKSINPLSMTQSLKLVQLIGFKLRKRSPHFSIWNAAPNFQRKLWAIFSVTEIFRFELFTKILVTVMLILLANKSKNSPLQKIGASYFIKY